MIGAAAVVLAVGTGVLVAAVCGWVSLRGQRRWERRLRAVTDRAQTDAAELSEATAGRQALELALDQLSVGVVLADRDGRTIHTNTAAQEVLGSSGALALVDGAVNSLIGQVNRQTDGFAEDSAASQVVGRRTVKVTGPPARILSVSAYPVRPSSVCSNPVRSSSVCSYPVRSYPAGGGRGAPGVVVAIEDRTETDRVGQIRRDFVADLSHELRTPAAAIALLADTLRNEQDALVRERLIARVGSEADRMGDIINDLLDLSHMELTGSLQPAKLDAGLLLAEVVDQFSAHAAAARVQLCLAGSGGATNGTVALMADRIQLLRALGNLVDNAIKYSDPGSVVDLSAAATKGAVEIVVTDHGIGIPRDQHERIFERFYRVDKARARATGGTGLGLSIVRHVVANHGGEVLLSSQEGVGTTFTLRFATADVGAAQ